MIKVKNIDAYIKMLDKDGKTFVVEEKRNSVSVIGSDGQVKAVLDRDNSVSRIQKEKGLKKGKLLSIFATVKKSFIAALAKNLDIEKVPQVHPSIFTNKTLYNSLRKGRVFYYVDINHCYWRIAYLQGYISEYYYLKILENPEYKLYRNMALASVKAPKTRKYHGNGDIITITEDNRILDVAYSNIRHTAWNLMGNIREEIGDDECIKYMTDGIMVFKKNLKFVCNCIEAEGLTYTVVKCKKIDNKQLETIDLDTGEIKISKI